MQQISSVVQNRVKQISTQNPVTAIAGLLVDGLNGQTVVLQKIESSSSSDVLSRPPQIVEHGHSPYLVVERLPFLMRIVALP
jgi:hypothetical protein